MRDDVSVEVAADEIDRTLRTPGWTLISEYLAQLAENKMVALASATTEFQLLRAASDVAALKSVEPLIRSYMEVLKREVQTKAAVGRGQPQRT